MDGEALWQRFRVPVGVGAALGATSALISRRRQVLGAALAGGVLGAVGEIVRTQLELGRFDVTTEPDQIEATPLPLEAP